MTQRHEDNGSKSVCVSAPGKVLVTGGYLVLDPKYAGLVLASTARFYARASSKAQVCRPLNCGNQYLPSGTHLTIPVHDVVQSAQSSSAYSGEDTNAIHVTIESPQFSQLVRGVLRCGAGDAYQFIVR